MHTMNQVERHCGLAMLFLTLIIPSRSALVAREYQLLCFFEVHLVSYYSGQALYGLPKRMYFQVKSTRLNVNVRIFYFCRLCNFDFPQDWQLLANYLL